MAQSFYTFSASHFTAFPLYRVGLWRLVDAICCKYNVIVNTMLIQCTMNIVNAMLTLWKEGLLDIIKIDKGLDSWQNLYAFLFPCLTFQLKELTFFVFSLKYSRVLYAYVDALFGFSAYRVYLLAFSAKCVCVYSFYALILSSFTAFLPYRVRFFGLMMSHYCGTMLTLWKDEV